MTSVLFDGWEMARRPNSPAALHLCALLAYLPAGVQAHVALPSVPPWEPPSVKSSPKVTQLHLEATSNTSAARLAWEQSNLPQMARRLAVDRLHLFSDALPLFSSTPCVFSPASYAGERQERQPSLSERLRLALGAGGLARVSGVIWPSDLPAETMPAAGLVSPLIIPPSFHQTSATNLQVERARLDKLGIPPVYYLYHGPTQVPDLHRLLGIWERAALVMGDACALVVAGLDESARARLQAIARDYELGHSVYPLSPQVLETLGALYRNSLALFHPAPVPAWGSPVRLSLVCGRPVVGLETPWMSAQAGPAAYLASEKVSGRILTAALITLSVEEEVLDKLSQAAQSRTAKWQTPERYRAFQQQLLSAYQDLA